MTYLIKFKTKDGVGIYKLKAASQRNALELLAIAMKHKDYEVIQTVGYCDK